MRSLGLALLLSLLLLACKGDDDQPATAETAEPVPTPAATAPPERTETPAPELPPPQPIAWQRCQLFQCASIDVPLDYVDPDRGDISLALIKRPAGNQHQRLGTLFVNPGGPGGSAVDFLRLFALLLPPDIHYRFDVIAFDPRGVGQSTPLDCGYDVQAILALDAFPETEADWQEQRREWQRFSEQCAEAGGQMLPFLGTANVARDMDRIREALGEQQVNYMGFSYGTSIGQVYADMFPGRVRAMVLDSAVDLSLPPEQRSLEQTLGFEAALGRYIESCRARACLPRDPAEAIRDLLDRVREAPLPAPNADRPAGSGEVLYGILASLYSRLTWSELDRGLREALEGDGSRLVRLADTLWGRKPDGSYDNSLYMNIAVNCVDYRRETDPDAIRQRAEEFEALAPVFGSFTASSGLTCAYWQAEPSPLSVPRAAGTPPILVIGSTGDPATPYKWSVALADQLELGVLLTLDGEGHGAYLLGGNACINDAVQAYLLRLQTPPEGTICGDAGIEPAPPVQP